MKKISLTQGQFAIVDDSDFEWLNQWKWCAANIRGAWYVIRTTSHISISLHGYIMKPPPNMEVDHKNGNGLDNRRCNLRVCTHAENLHNQRPQVGKTSRHKGVHWYHYTNRYVAKIKNKGVQRHLGYFKDEDDAGRAYDKKAIELFGEYAWLNFPQKEI